MFLSIREHGAGRFEGRKDTPEHDTIRCAPLIPPRFPKIDGLFDVSR